MRERLYGWPVAVVLCAVAVVLCAVAVVLCADDARAAEGTGARSWPVAGPPGAPRPAVVRGWDPPSSPWGAGHRGVDLGTQAGAEVRAVAAGRVSFAGSVAGRGVVTVTLRGTGEPALRVTYEPVRAMVEVGDTVRAGDVVGRVQNGPFHCARACLHWGLLRGEVYLDPVSLLPRRMVRAGTVRLLPFLGDPGRDPDPRSRGAAYAASPTPSLPLLARGVTRGRRPISPGPP